jgi:uncharacterized damage-inducible protein DinB
MSIAAAFIAELEMEAKSTREALSRIPQDKLAWKPHVKSMSLGQLGWHIANALAITSRLAQVDSFEASSVPPQPELQSAAALPGIFDESVKTATETLASFDDAIMARSWTLTRGGQTLMTITRQALVRGVMLNHLYHHRGQLTVYLRMLDIPVPSIYGPSADEGRF